MKIKELQQNGVVALFYLHTICIQNGFKTSK